MRNKIIAILRDNSNGKVVEFKDEYNDVSEEGCDFIWLEGNFSCDCNRLIFMYPELTVDWGNDKNHKCGDIRFSLLKLTLDGKILYEGDDRK